MTAIFDALLALGLLTFAFLTLAVRDAFTAIVLFISTGLIIALIWARLGAPDIAIAEAAIGAGLTGALLLAAWRQLAATAPAPDARRAVTSSGRFPEIVPAALLAIALMCVGVLLGYSFLITPQSTASLTELALGALPRSGVDNPVTAVLLNYRAFDTMLELVVLLLVAMALITLEKSHAEAMPIRRPPRGSSLLQSLVRDLTPLIVLVGGYLLWIGAKEPGGAFQAGAVLASAAVLAHLLNGPVLTPWRTWQLNGLLSLGTGAFLVAALSLMFITGTYFAYPTDSAGAWILAIEAAATIAIAAALYTAFRLVMPREDAS